MSLQEPSLKMSKSHPNPLSRIILTDSADEILRKIRAALTDSVNHVSYDPISRPGVANLLQLLSYFSALEKSPEELGEVYAAMSLGSFKILVAQTISDALESIRIRFDKIMAEDDGRYLDNVEAEGAVKARASADVTILAVKEAVGL